LEIVLGVKPNDLAGVVPLQTIRQIVADFRNMLHDQGFVNDCIDVVRRLPASKPSIPRSVPANADPLDDIPVALPEYNERLHAVFDRVFEAQREALAAYDLNPSNEEWLRLQLNVMVDYQAHPDLRDGWKDHVLSFGERIVDRAAIADKKAQ